MQSIKILDKETVNRIAAGEVIERPYSVVKELIENSIDAAADNIIVEVKDGGKTYIKITDNGTGMGKEDAKLCFFRHATSKLHDLFRINTLGFRGEALSSIAAVSNFKLSTNENDSGIQIEVCAGELRTEKEIGMNKGTIIEIDDLFFNTPVRLKYLKSKEVELSHIIDIVTRYSLANKQISFRLINDGKEVIVSPKSDNLLNKIVGIYGKEIAKNMVAIDYSDDFVKINGYIGKPYLTKTDRSMQSLFVNSRYVKSEVISKAIYDAYNRLLFLNRHPVIILNFEIDFSDIDVNVHPTKNVIRIEKEDKLYESVFNALRNSFVETNLIPDVSVENQSNISVKQNYNIEHSKQTLLMAREAEEAFENAKPIQTTNRIGPVLILGQLNKMYILAESADGLLIIDQHALQEKIFFEEFWNQYNAKAIVQQKLLKPLIIELGINEHTVLQNNIDTLISLGFDIEEYDKNSFIIRQVPKMFKEFSKQTILDLINEIRDTKKIIDEIKEKKIAKMACRKAVKAGQSLTKPEMETLISNLDKCENPYACPHGRPTMINITLGDLEKKFKRTA